MAAAAAKQVSVLLSASVEGFGVSRMRDFFSLSLDIFWERGGEAKSKPLEELFQPKFGNFLRKGGGGEAKSKPLEELFHLRFGHFTRGGSRRFSKNLK